MKQLIDIIKFVAAMDILTAEELTDAVEMMYGAGILTATEYDGCNITIDDKVQIKLGAFECNFERSHAPYLVHNYYRQFPPRGALPQWLRIKKLQRKGKGEQFDLCINRAAQIQRAVKDQNVWGVKQANCAVEHFRKKGSRKKLRINP